jgi:hypothetical protein
MRGREQTNLVVSQWMITGMVTITKAFLIERERDTRICKDY